MAGLPWWLSGKESACNAGVTGDAGLIPESGRFPGGGNGNPLQYSFLENPMERSFGRLQSVVSERAGNDQSNLVQFSRSVVSDSLQSHGLQHARLPCPSPTPRHCSDWCPLRWWSIQPPHPLSSSFPPAFKLAQHQGLAFTFIDLTQHQVLLQLHF